MRKGLVLAVVCAALAACSPPAAKTEPAAPGAAAALEAAPVVPVISDGWAAVTPNGAKVAAGYMKITNPGSEPDTLVSVSSQRAPKVEVHEMKMDGAMMSMAPVAGGLAIPAGGSVTLEPGGLHVMFMGIDAGFIEGEIVPLTLTFAKAGDVPATLTVRKPDPAAASSHH